VYSLGYAKSDRIPAHRRCLVDLRAGIRGAPAKFSLRPLTSAVGSEIHTRRGNEARSTARTGRGGRGSRFPRGTRRYNTGWEHANTLANLVDDQRRRKLKYKSPACLYAGATAH
jgi:hypothetical protein